MLFSREGAGAGYERLVVVQRPLGLHAVIAVHSTRRGPAFGGIRRKHYASEAAALDDALALAEAMSHKCALAGLPAGGAKTVVLRSAGPHDAVDWEAAYEALGREIAALQGAYVCGPDIGTGEIELAAVRRTCSFVNPLENDAGASTAAGVHAGLRAVWRVLGPSSLPRTVAIQGLGSVGRALALALVEEGVEVIGADLEAEACREAAQLGVRIVEPATLMAQPCDVLIPCAGGHGLDAVTIAGLRCRAVCGSANNQLASAEDAMRLLGRGIVHAPDVIVSAGAVIEGVLTMQQGRDASVRSRVDQAITAIEGTLEAVLEQALAQGKPPTEVARAQAQRLLDA